MDLRPLVQRRRRGAPLGPEELGALVDAVHRGTAPIEQTAALLVAVVMSGLTDDEAVVLTELLVASGDRITHPADPRPTVDKHSTGGVADTTTLIVVPLIAACGGRVTKLSGRALGHTGGTVDKLLAIPGLEVDLGAERMRRQADEVGAVIAAASRDLAPADAALYGLRDRIGAVDDPALIAASIMSKKIAGGADHIVLDVKTGEGAFLPELGDARRLAELCVRIAASHDRRAMALLTDMSRPLGMAVGDALEVAAAVDVLAGRARGRLGELSVELATAGLTLAGRDPTEARRDVEQAIEDGAGLERFGAMVAAQGGPSSFVDDPWSHLTRAAEVGEWVPPSGVLAGWSCRGLGELARDLASSAPPEQAHASGLELLADVGDVVGGGAAVRVHAHDQETVARAVDRLAGLADIREGGAPGVVPLVIDRVGGV